MNKKILCLLISLSIATLTFSQSTPHLDFNYQRDFKRFLDYTKDNESDLYYNKLLYKFLTNDSTLSSEDALVLMIGYTDKPDFKPLDDLLKEKEICNLVTNSNYAIAIQLAKKFLAKHPLNLMALQQITIAYNSLNMKDSANHYMKQHIKIMDAMIYSGSGKTPENPIYALNLADGEYFTNNIGYDITKKETNWNKKGDFIEIIQATNQKLTNKVLYFVIQHAKAKVDNDKANSDAYNKKLKDSINTQRIEQRKKQTQIEPSDEDAERIQSNAANNNESATTNSNNTSTTISPENTTQSITEEKSKSVPKTDDSSTNTKPSDPIEKSGN